MCQCKARMSCKSRYWIVIVDDWNEIFIDKPEVICTELGCWLGDGQAYPKHFGLLFTGVRPRLHQIMQSIDVLINHEKESIQEIEQQIKRLGFK